MIDFTLSTVRVLLIYIYLYIYIYLSIYIYHHRIQLFVFGLVEQASNERKHPAVLPSNPTSPQLNAASCISV